MVFALRLAVGRERQALADRVQAFVSVLPVEAAGSPAQLHLAAALLRPEREAVASDLVRLASGRATAELATRSSAAEQRGMKAPAVLGWAQEAVAVLRAVGPELQGPELGAAAGPAFGLVRPAAREQPVSARAVLWAASAGPASREAMPG